MELIGILNKEEHLIDITKVDEQRYSVTIWNDEEKTGSRTYEVDLLEPQPNLYSLLHGQDSYEVRMVELKNGDLVSHFYDESYTITMTDPMAQLLAQAVGGAVKGEAALEAAMPGQVQRILVKEGDQVEEEQGLVVLVAMKMENELVSPKAGVVKKILVNEGDNVDGGSPLIIVG